MQQLYHLVQVQPTVAGFSVEVIMPAFAVIVSSGRLTTLMVAKQLRQPMSVKHTAYVGQPVRPCSRLLVN